MPVSIQGKYILGYIAIIADFCQGNTELRLTMLKVQNMQFILVLTTQNALNERWNFAFQEKIFINYIVCSHLQYSTTCVV